MNLFLIFLSIPIILLTNKFLINKNYLLNFSGEFHQGFVVKNKTPLSGGIIILFFLLINLADYDLNLLIFFILIFILGIISDTHFIKSPTVRIVIQFLLILSLVFFFDIKVKDLRIDYLNNLLAYDFICYLFITFCLLILINGSNFIDGCNTLVLGYYILILLILKKLDYFPLVDISESFILDFIFVLLILFVFNLFGKLFLGDNGVYIISLFFGYFLINIYLNNKLISPYFIALLLWYPAYENLFSMIRKIRKNLSPMLPDTNHFHQLVFYFLKKKFFKKNILANSLSANIINFYNGIIFFIASTNVSGTKFQIKLIIINIIIYSVLYILLYKFRSKKN